MNVAFHFKSETVSDLNLQARALYLLAAPSTPDEARAEAIERAQNGETITHPGCGVNPSPGYGLRNSQNVRFEMHRADSGPPRQLCNP